MRFAMVDEPRYPSIFVETESQNPLALVAAVREALRLAHVKPAEIRQFSDQAFDSESPEDVEEVCLKWVHVGRDPETG